MKKSLFVLFLYSSLLTASEIAYRFVFGIETLPAAKMAETFALTFVIAALYLFARYKATRLLIAVFFAFSIIANNVHYAVYQSWMTGINYWLMLKEVTEVGSAGASMLDKLWLPALWGVAEVVLFCSLAKFRRKTHFTACSKQNRARQYSKYRPDYGRKRKRGAFEIVWLRARNFAVFNPAVASRF